MAIQSISGIDIIQEGFSVDSTITNRQQNEEITREKAIEEERNRKDEQKGQLMDTYA